MKCEYGVLTQNLWNITTGRAEILPDEDKLKIWPRLTETAEDV